MIRLYKTGDENGLDPNEFSDWTKVKEILASEDWWKYTLIDNGVRAIVCFFEYEPHEFALFGLFGKTLSGSHGRELKQILDNGIDKLGARRVVTWSKACAVLNRWHRFLGFEILEPKKVDEEIFYLWGKIANGF